MGHLPYCTLEAGCAALRLVLEDLRLRGDEFESKILEIEYELRNAEAFLSHQSEPMIIVEWDQPDVPDEMEM